MHPGQRFDGVRRRLTKVQPNGVRFLFAPLQLVQVVPLRRKKADAQFAALSGQQLGKLLPEFSDSGGHLHIRTADGDNRRSSLARGFRLAEAQTVALELGRYATFAV